MTYYILCDEDGETTLKYDDFDEATISPCCWPTIVRVTVDEYHAKFEEFAPHGGWKEV